MVSTRLVPLTDATGLPSLDRRHRVDPVKLLALIERIRASGGTSEPVRIAPSKPSATKKAG